MKAIMYHYVRKFNKDLPNFRFLCVNEFKKQLDFFEKEYGFVSKNEWDNYIKGHGMKNGKGKIILTFDDAINDSYDYIFPELIKRKLWGIFYIPTQPYIYHTLLDIHKIHLLCGAFDGQKLMECLSKLLTDEMMSEIKKKNFQNETYTKQKNDFGVTEFKRVLNYFIPYNYRESMINEIALQLNYVFNINNFYISPSNLVKMKQEGMIIGAHSINHIMMSELTRDEQYVQINDSFEYIEKIKCVTHKTYCHPFGGFHSFNKNTIDLLSKANVAYSFNVESRDIEENDINKSRHSLPRFDCSEFPHGQIS